MSRWTAFDYKMDIRLYNDEKNCDRKCKSIFVTAFLYLLNIHGQVDEFISQFGFL